MCTSVICSDVVEEVLESGKSMPFDNEKVKGDEKSVSAVSVPAKVFRPGSKISRL